jgi:hypothetical protein
MTPYPPERNTWEYPPPPVSRRWFWVALLVIVVSVALAAGLAVTGVKVASKDFPSVIEDHQIVDVIAKECAVMTSTVESMPVAGSPRQQAAILADQDRAVGKMLQAIRLIDPGVRAADKPTDQWLHDWDRLLDARMSYGVLVARGYQPTLRIPRDADGDPIYKRMNDAWLTTTACRVPHVLLSPKEPNIQGV